MEELNEQDAQVADEIMFYLHEKVEKELPFGVGAFDQDGNPTLEYTKAFLTAFAKELKVDEQALRQDIADELGVPVENVIESMMVYNTQPKKPLEQLELFPDENVKKAVDITEEFEIPERVAETEVESENDIPPVL